MRTVRQNQIGISHCPLQAWKAISRLQQRLILIGSPDNIDPQQLSSIPSTFKAALPEAQISGSDLRSQDWAALQKKLLKEKVGSMSFRWKL